MAATAAPAATPLPPPLGDGPAAAATAALAAVLDQLVVPDTAVVRAAEHQLRALLARPDTSVAALAALATAAHAHAPPPPPHTRHLAAVLLRRAVRRHWARVPPAHRDAVRAALLARLRDEHDPAPRRGVAAAAAAVCRAERALWPELLQAAAALARDPDPARRAAALGVLDALAETVPALIAAAAGAAATAATAAAAHHQQQQQHAATTTTVPVFALIGAGLADTDPAVQLAALIAFTSTAHALQTFPTTPTEQQQGAAATGANNSSNNAPVHGRSDDNPAWTRMANLIPAVAAVAKAAAYRAAAAAAAAAAESSSTALQATCPSAHTTTAAYNKKDEDASRPITLSTSDDVSRILCVVFDLFSSLGESGGQAAMRDHLQPLFCFALDLATLPTMPNAAREAAVQFVCTNLRAKPKTLKRSGLVQLALSAAFRMALLDACHAASSNTMSPSSRDEDPDDDDDRDDETNGVDLGLRIVYAAVCRVELARLVFEEVMQGVALLMGNDLSTFQLPAPVANHDAAAIAYRLIATVSDGCAGEVTVHAADILGRLADGATNMVSSRRARGYAMESISIVVSSLDSNEMGDDVRESVADVCLGAVLTAMRDPSLFVRRNACIALEPILELFDDDGNALRERLDDVLQALHGLGSDAVIEAVTAAAVIAENIGSDFVSSNAYRGVIDTMGTIMSSSDIFDVSARAAATQAAGIVISSCRNWDVAEHLAARAIHGLDVEDAGLAEATYSFFGRLADSHGGRVAFAYGEKILRAAIASVNREDVVFVSDRKIHGANLIFSGKDPRNVEEDRADDEMYSDSDASGAETGAFQIRTALLDEKAMAIGCIGAMSKAVATSEFLQMAKAGGSEASTNVSVVLELLNSGGEALDPMVTYFHEEVRAMATRADVMYAIAAIDASVLSSSLKFGPEDVTERAMGRMLYTLQEDEDIMVVTSALHACATFVAQCPLLVLEKHKDGILRIVEILIEGKSTCQMTIDETDDEDEGTLCIGQSTDGDDDEIDQGDDAAGLFDAVCEVISSLARSMRGHFVGDFSKLIPLLQSMLIAQSSLPRKTAMTAMVLGMLADVFLFLNWKRCTRFKPPESGSPAFVNTIKAVTELAESLYPLVISIATGHGFSSKTLQRNSVFLVGVLHSVVFQSATPVWSHLDSTLQLLQSLVTRGKESNGTLVDNAAGAIARIMTADGLPPGAIGSFRAALHLILNVVPIENDPAENTPVARAVLYTASSGDFAALEIKAAESVSCLVSAVLLGLEQADASALGTVSGPGYEGDPNDHMTRLDDSELSQVVQLLARLAQTCGSEPFARLNLLPDDRARLSQLLPLLSGC